MGVMKLAAEAKATINTKGTGFKSRFADIVKEIGKIIAAAAFEVIYAARMVVIKYIPNKTPKVPSGMNSDMIVSAIRSAAPDFVIAIPKARESTIIIARL